MEEQKGAKWSHALKQVGGILFFVLTFPLREACVWEKEWLIFLKENDLPLPNNASNVADFKKQFEFWTAKYNKAAYVVRLDKVFVSSLLSS